MFGFERKPKASAEQEKMQPPPQLADTMAMKYERVDVPSLSDQEHTRLSQLVDQYPQFAANESDPRYQEWETLQKRADADVDARSGAN